MNRIQAFRGWRYDLRVAGATSLDELLAPPYDVISPLEQAALYARHPYNIIRLDLGRDEPGDDDLWNRYARAAADLAAWQHQGILRQERRPAIYLLRERFVLPNGQQALRTGAIFRLRLAPWGEGILPHERTFPAAKADRLALTIATEAQFSPIFLLYADPDGQAQSALASAARRRPSAMLVHGEGIEQSLWAISDTRVIAEFARALAPATFYVADGHHRYETALNYQRFRRGGGLPDTPAPAPLTNWSAVPRYGRHLAPGPERLQPYDHAWVYAAAMKDPGVVILPTHRCVHDVPGFDANHLLAGLRTQFNLVPMATDTALLEALAKVSPGDHAFGLVLPGPGPAYLLQQRPEVGATSGWHEAPHPAVMAVDVAALQGLVLGPWLGISAEPGELKRHVHFTPSAQEAIEQTRGGAFQAAFLVKPTTLDQLRDVSNAGQVMPPKATYFYPKLPSGLVINSLGS
jgi:uncharacterized protein (DUF1015 family)